MKTKKKLITSTICKNCKIICGYNITKFLIHAYTLIHLEVNIIRFILKFIYKLNIIDRNSYILPNFEKVT